MIDLTKEEMDTLLERSKETIKTEGIVILADNSSYRIVDPTKDFPPGIYRFYATRIHCPAAELIAIEARNSLENGDREKFLKLRQAFYTLTGYYI